MSTGSGRRRLRTVLGASAAAALALAGCGGSVSRLTVPDPPSVTVAAPAPPDSLPADLASRSEPTVAGVTTTTAPALGPGPESVTGTVLGPGGPVPGATVEVDRFVADGVASGRATTAADGSFTFRHVLGGRYRVRAWQAPALDMATPQVIFVGGGQTPALTLQLTSYAGQQVQVAINPSAPVQGQAADLVVQVTDPSVSADGVLTNAGVAHTPVTLVNGPGWEVTNGNPLDTDTNGQVLFAVICTAVGDDPLSAQVANQTPVSLQMPPCGAPATTTVPTSPPTTAFGFGEGTTTTCPSPTTNPAEPGTTSTSLAFGGC